MPLSPQFKAICFISALLWSLGYFSPSEKLHPDGILLPGEPYQNQSISIPAWNSEGYLISPLASYTISARVLSRENYWLGREAKLSPVDLALGWGPASDNRLLKKLRISQGGRFYHWSAKDPDIDVGAIVSHSANVHVLPANESIRKRLSQLVKGDLLSMQGYLVRVSASDGFNWVSSLSRLDTGNGACEVFWVTNLTEL